MEITSRAQWVAALFGNSSGLGSFAAGILHAHQEFERRGAELMAVCGDFATFDDALALAKERHRQEVAISQRHPWAPRSLPAVIAEVAGEEASRSCRWPGILTPGREVILLARDVESHMQAREYARALPRFHEAVKRLASGD